MRKYRSTSGIERTATMERIDESYGPYFGSHVIARTKSERGTAGGHFGSYGEAFDWLVGNFGCGWTRER